MMNFIKSEFYRVWHTRGIWYSTGILAALALLIQVILWWFGRNNEGFPYATSSYAYSILVSSPLLFVVAGTLIGMLLYEGYVRNGCMKNAVSFGISRAGIFAGQCIVAAVTSVVMMVIILGVYIAGASLLLVHTGPVGLGDLLTEVPAVGLIAVASLISGIGCVQIFGKESIGAVCWACLWFVLPRIMYALGLLGLSRGVDLIYRIAMWMPANLFGSATMRVNRSECMTVWGTSEGMLQCLLCGVIGMVLFSVVGAVLLRKRDV